jgi:hypothetical protein
MAISDGVRGALATSLSGVAANVHAVAPESIVPPTVVILADSPYMTPNIINKSVTKVQVNLVISMAVAYNSNAAALDNLEQLTIAVLAAMPAGYEIGNIEAPYQIETNNGHVLLACDMRVSTYYTQGA